MELMIDGVRVYVISEDVFEILLDAIGNYE
jgi:hypothetical protein